MTTLDLLNTPKAAAMSLANGFGHPEAATGSMVAVPLVQILDNPYQPRGSYDPEHILKLAASIKALKRNLPATMGLQQVPLARLVLRQRDGGLDVASRSLYERGRAQRAIHEERNAAVQLMFGHSRLRALMVLNDGLRYALKHDHTGIKFGSVPEVETAYAELLDPDGDYATMPVVLGFALDHEMWKHAITENSQRKNITAIEEAVSIERAMEEFGLSIEEAAKPFGYQRSTAANKVRLRKLPADVQKAISAGDLSERHGRELLRVIDDPARVKKLFDLAINKSLSVRQLAENVDWEEKRLKADQEKARQVAAARAALATWQTPMGETLTPDRVKDTQSWQVTAFDKSDPKHRILVEQGGCSAQACDCFAVVHSTYHHEQSYRPDADKAPNFCLGCTEQNHLFGKCRALGEVKDDSADARAKAAAEAERRRQIEAINTEAASVWQRWLRDQDKHALWNSLAFWRVVVKAYGYGLDQVFEQSADLDEACTLMLAQMYRSTREHNSELREYMHSVANVRKLIKALGSVSRETEYAGIQEVFEGDDDESDEG